MVMDAAQGCATSGDWVTAFGIKGIKQQDDWPAHTVSVRSRISDSRLLFGSHNDHVGNLFELGKTNLSTKLFR